MANNLKYRMIDKRESNVHEELREYTFEEIKAYFEPSKEDFAESWERWNKVADLCDLTEYLDMEADGMVNPYVFEEVGEV